MVDRCRGSTPYRPVSGRLGSSVRARRGAHRTHRGAIRAIGRSHLRLGIRGRRRNLRGRIRRASVSPSQRLRRGRAARVPERRSPAARLVAGRQVVHASDYHRRVNDEAVTDTRELPGEAEAWQRLHRVINRITPEMADVAGYFEEGWTAKDAGAHLGTWMAAGAAMLRQIAAGTYREGEIDIDAENARYLAAMHDIPWEVVHVQAEAGRRELLNAWAELPEITPAARFWVHKAGPEHLEEHVPRLEEWVAELERRN